MINFSKCFSKKRITDFRSSGKTSHFLHRRPVSTDAAPPQLCLDHRKCKIAFVYNQLCKAGGGLKVQQPAWMMAERQRVKQQTGRIWERVCLQAASEAQPRMCCKTVVKQIGPIFFTVCIARHLFSSAPTPPPRPSSRFSFWMGRLTHMLPFCGTVSQLRLTLQENEQVGPENIRGVWLRSEAWHKQNSHSLTRLSVRLSNYRLAFSRRS